MTSFDGRVAVVTGGRGDIGSALVEALVERGARVAVADLAPLPGSHSPGVMHARVDVTDPVAIEAWLDDVEASFGVATLVVPAAATATAATVLDMTPDAWRRELDADLTAPFLLVQSAARRMVRAGLAGRIAMVGSWAAEAAHPHVPAYSVAKAGLRMLTRVLAADLARHQILVNELAIGVVDAGVSRITFEAHPELRERAAKQSPLGRLVDISEIVDHLIALLDPAAVAMTGTTVTLDAGVSLRAALAEGSDRR